MANAKIMRYTCFFILFFVSCSGTIAQDMRIKFDLSLLDKQVKSIFINKLNTIYSDVISDVPTPFIVGADVKEGKIQTIEGTEVIRVSRSKVSFEITNSLTEDKKLISFSYNITVENGKSLSMQIIDAFMKDSKNQEILKREITQFLENALENCDQYRKAANEFKERKKYFNAYLMLHFLREAGVCQDKLDFLMQEISALYFTDLCNEKLYTAGILVHSNDPSHHKEAIEILLRVPPASDCRARAIELSKILAEKPALIQQDKNRIFQYINMNEKTTTLWSGQFWK